MTGFTDPACPLGSESADVVAANVRLLKAFRQKKLPIFFTTVVYRNDDQAKVFRNRIPALNLLKSGSEWTALDPVLEHDPSEPVIEKHWASAFFKTDLDHQLRVANANSLIVTGLTTSGCVRATVLDGLQNEFPVFVPREAVGDRNPDAHEANLFDMHAKYADVLSIDVVLDHIVKL